MFQRNSLRRKLVHQVITANYMHNIKHHYQIFLANISSLCRGFIVYYSHRLYFPLIDWLNHTGAYIVSHA